MEELVQGDVRLKIKCTRTDKNLEVNVSPSSDTVQTLKNKVISLMELDDSVSIKMIYYGKLLDPPSALLDSFKIKNDTFVHVQISNAQPPQSSSNNVNEGGEEETNSLLNSFDDEGDIHTRNRIWSARYENHSEMGTHMDLIYGFLAGYALGSLVIFFIWDQNISHRLKVGLFAGLLMSYSSTSGSLSPTTHLRHDSASLSTVTSSPTNTPISS